MDELVVLFSNKKTDDNNAKSNLFLNIAKTNDSTWNCSITAHPMESFRGKGFHLGSKHWAVSISWTYKMAILEKGMIILFLNISLLNGILVYLEGNDPLIPLELYGPLIDLLKMHWSVKYTQKFAYWKLWAYIT